MADNQIRCVVSYGNPCSNHWCRILLPKDLHAIVHFMENWVKYPYAYNVRFINAHTYASYNMQRNKKETEIYNFDSKGPFETLYKFHNKYYIRILFSWRD